MMKCFSSAWGRIRSVLRWTRTSYILLSTFLAVIFLILIVWWPLVTEYVRSYDPQRPFWVQMDWLLLGIFAAMSLLIMSGADLKADAKIVLVGLAGGLVIESWGTQTLLWNYFTLERPPLWIIPAWPVASLAIDRLVRILEQLTANLGMRWRRAKWWFYWPVFGGFLALMLAFVWPTLGKSLTVMALLLCGFLIATPTNARKALLNFAAGAGLGYFLELWGTTRYCWTYYTHQTPPIFAVLAHGMAAVAFWRVVELVKVLEPSLGRIRGLVQPGRGSDLADS
jgi:hypothetical protein